MTIPHHEAAPRRLVAVVAIGALLALGGLADRAHRPRPPQPNAARFTDVGMPAAAPAGALSSSWFCAFVGGPSGISVQGVLGIVNPNGDAVSGSVSYISDQGPIRTVPVALGAHALLEVSEPSVPGYLAALVNMDGGDVAVEQAITGSAGSAGAPCATSAATQWHFADGTTAKDDSLLIGLFNPFPDDAVVDFAFTTEQGREGSVGALQAVPVPARSLVVVDIGQHLRRRAHVATSITARLGRIVAAQIQTKQPASGPAGISLEVGGGRPQTAWTFADGIAGPGIAEAFHLYNPGPNDAHVQVTLVLDQGSADPFTLDVPALGTATIDANHDGRIPANVGHAVTFTSLNGVGVIVDRSYDVALTTHHTAVVQSTAATEAALGWAFAFGQTTGADEWLAVFNPGTAPVKINVIIPDNGLQLPIAGLEGVTIPARRRLVIHLNPLVQRAALPLFVEASGPVVAERSQNALTGPGGIDAVGVPLVVRTLQPCSNC